MNKQQQQQLDHFIKVGTRIWKDHCKALPEAADSETVKRRSSSACSPMEDITADIRNKLTPALTLAEITDDPEKAALCKKVKAGISHILSQLKALEENESR